MDIRITEITRCLREGWKNSLMPCLGREFVFLFREFGTQKEKRYGRWFQFQVEVIGRKLDHAGKEITCVHLIANFVNVAYVPHVC